MLYYHVMLATSEGERLYMTENNREFYCVIY